MELIGSIPLIGPIVVWVVPFLVVLSIVVAVHELGHLLVGRWCGIKAEVFSIGFGKVLWSRTDRLGTRWQVAALPIGGYVKFLGDMDPASAGKVDDHEIAPGDRRHAFHNAALWRRALTVVAGPVANFMLSLVIFFALGLAGEKPSDEPVIAVIHADRQEDVVGLQAGDRVLSVGGVETATFGDVIEALSRTNGAPTELVVERDGRPVEIEARYASPPIVTGLTADGAAIGAGVRPNDRLLEIGGSAVNSAREVQLAIAELPRDEPVTFTIRRDGEVIDLTFTPKLRERIHPETGELEEIPFLGIAMQDVGVEPIMLPSTVADAAEYAGLRVWRIVADTVLYIKEMLLHGADTSQLSGPIGIAKHSTDAASQGALQFLFFVGFVSTAIGLLNLFPIPVLDGGHLVFYLAEAIRGKPNNEIVVRYGTMVGLSLLLLLMVYVTFNNDLGLGAWLGQG
jgi:regulator of sigma E protease